MGSTLLDIIWDDDIWTIVAQVQLDEDACSEADLMMIYRIVNEIKIHWPSLIYETMIKAKRHSRALIPTTRLTILPSVKWDSSCKEIPKSIVMMWGT
ncbi:hypothetical protein LR48_Vigan03g179100 [Vigna angularis]|uniref:Uncharacterized protein n=1 Tax=Phaseolus angularis TaxID=3914 RepID=A0A0L9U7I2_PHAAN|nr:hypothetical protein LR48_Vigan03g179100 [Vigna angularis]